MNRRARFFQQCDADVVHQQIAGLASWAAFSARWRARQGLPLLHPMDVQYLTPQDFCNQHQQPLPPEKQRRLFRQYVEAAVQCLSSSSARRHRPPCPSADLAFLRVEGFVRLLGVRQDVVYGRPDLGPSEACAPARPYGVPTTSETFPAYWLTEDAFLEEEGDDSWIPGVLQEDEEDGITCREGQAE